MALYRLFIAVILAAAVGAAGTAWTISSRNWNAGLRRVPMAGPAAGPQTNPIAGDPKAVAEGRSLFMAMNCAGCHGYDAKGGMGPDLTDTYWRYGGTPDAVYQTIHDGRPQGMPSWGKALPASSMWALVSYIQSLGGTVAAGQGETDAASAGRPAGTIGASDQR
jgi:cytochrome c oxidase cbb3-type subunit III